MDGLLRSLPCLRTLISRPRSLSSLDRRPRTSPSDLGSRLKNTTSGSLSSRSHALLRGLDGGLCALLSSLGGSLRGGLGGLARGLNSALSDLPGRLYVALGDLRSLLQLLLVERERRVQESE